MSNPVATLSQPCARTVAELLSEAAQLGVTCWAEGDAVRVKGPKSAVAVGAEIVARKAEVLEHLALVWNLDAALALMYETDGAVERSGVSGFDAVISAAAGRCVEAQRARDMAGVVAACAAIRTRVIQLGHESAHRGSA